MSKIIVLGRKELPKGYCQQADKFSSDEYWDTIEKIKRYIPRGLKLRSISVSSNKALENSRYLAPPTILKYSKDIDPIFNPIEIFNYCKSGEDIYRPLTDFIIFKGSESFMADRIAVLAYSKTAPILIFKDGLGNIAIGTIATVQVTRYGEWLFQTIGKAMLGPTKLIVPICTDYANYITELAKKFVNIEEVVIYPDNANNYGDTEQQNNAVIVW